MMRIFLAGLFACAALAACAEQQQPQANTEMPIVPWDEALRVLNEGNVDTVFQGHDLWVGFTMKDGTQFSTKAPGLDLIITEIEKCAKCENVGIILE